MAMSEPKARAAAMARPKAMVDGRVGRMRAYNQANNAARNKKYYKIHNKFRNKVLNKDAARQKRKAEARAIWTLNGALNKDTVRQTKKGKARMQQCRERAGRSKREATALLKEARTLVEDLCHALKRFTARDVELRSTLEEMCAGCASGGGTASERVCS
jgi:hypothetical protein